MVKFTRRQFLKTSLAASALLAMPAFASLGGRRQTLVHLPLGFASHITEGKFEETAGYTYHANALYYAPRKPDKVWLDGQLTDHPWVYADGHVWFEALPLAPYGNRVPAATALFVEK